MRSSLSGWGIVILTTDIPINCYIFHMDSRIHGILYYYMNTFYMFVQEKSCRVSLPHAVLIPSMLGSPTNEGDRLQILQAKETGLRPGS